MGAPAEIAEAVAYLASDGAAFTTGQILRIDGGGSDVVQIPGFTLVSGLGPDDVSARRPLHRVHPDQGDQAPVAAGGLVR